MLARAEVWNRTVKTADLSITGGSVTYDSAAAFPRSCSVTLAGFDAIIPDASGLGYRGTFADTDGVMGDGIFGDPLNRELRGLLVPGPNQLRLFVRVVFGPGDFEEVPMGRYDISRPRFTHTRSDGIQAQVTGYDVARRVRKAGYVAPYNVAQGTNVRTALIQHLQSCVPGVSVTVPSTTFVTPGMTFLPTQGVDPLQDAQEIAYSGGWILSTTRSGGLIAAAPADPGSAPAVWSIDESQLTSLETGQDDEDAVNVLVITGEDADGNAVYGSYSQTTGQWGTAELGRRAVVEESEYVTSNPQAEIMAQTKLPKYLGLADASTATIPIAPHLDHGDVVSTNDPVMQLDDSNFLSERLVHDFGAKTTTLTVSRRLS